MQFANNFVLIVGQSLHRVLFHMTSRSIVPNEESVSGYMVQKDVNYIKLFSVDGSYFMLSVNNYMMRIAKVSQINAEVRCMATSDL